MSKTNTSSKSLPEPLRGRNPNHTAWLLRRIWERVNKRNEHFMGCIVGREGSGKSQTALKICNNVDPTFTAERVIFDVKELLEVLRNDEHEPGNFYLLDEAGAQLGNRTWQDRGQILANQALQLIRDHNLGLVFTLPRLSELDSQAEGRLQALFELIDKREGKWVEGKWKWMDPDRANDTGTIYKKYPKRYVNGHMRRITRLRFAPADPEVVEPYEKMKTKFQDKFYEKTIEKLEPEEDTEDSEKTVKEWATDIAKDGIENVVSEHGNTGEPYINAQLIRAQYETTHDDSKAIKSLLEKQFDVSNIVA